MMRQKFFIKSSCQGNKLFLFEIVCFKTTTESLGNISEFGQLCVRNDCINVEYVFPIFGLK